MDRRVSQTTNLVFDADGTSKPWTKAAICFTSLTSTFGAGACVVAHQGVLAFAFVFLLILTATAATWLIARDMKAADLALKRQFPPYDPDWKLPYLRGNSADRTGKGSTGIE